MKLLTFDPLILHVATMQPAVVLNYILPAWHAVIEQYACATSWHKETEPAMHCGPTQTNKNNLPPPSWWASSIQGPCSPLWTKHCPEGWRSLLALPWFRWAGVHCISVNTKTQKYPSQSYTVVVSYTWHCCLNDLGRKKKKRRGKWHRVNTVSGDIRPSGVPSSVV